MWSSRRSTDRRGRDVWQDAKENSCTTGFGSLMGRIFGWHLACTGTFVQWSDFVETDGRPSLQRVDSISV